jgi:hypothetical protein
MAAAEFQITTESGQPACRTCHAHLRSVPNGTTDTDAVVEAATKSIAAGAATAAALLMMMLLLQIHDQHHTP